MADECMRDARLHTMRSGNSSGSGSGRGPACAHGGAAALLLLLLLLLLRWSACTPVQQQRRMAEPQTPLCLVISQPAVTTARRSQLFVSLWIALPQWDRMCLCGVLWAPDGPIRLMM